MSSASLSVPLLKQKALAHWDLVNRLASKRFYRNSTAEEAALYVMDQLSRDDWKRLQQFGGKSRFTTYFSSVVYRLLEDYSRKRFGRKSPPKWLAKRGGIWLSLYRLLCLERFTYVDAVSMASDRHTDARPESLERAAEKILAELPRCGEEGVVEQGYNEEFQPEMAAISDSAYQTTAEFRQKKRLLEALLYELLGETRYPGKGLLEKLLPIKITLNPEERLLLKLCHCEGMSAAEAGRRLGLSRHQTHGKLRRLYKRIRRCFTDAGCESALLQLLEES